MKRNLKSFVALVLAILMVVPFSAIASAAEYTSDVPTTSMGNATLQNSAATAIEVPAEPTLTSTKVLYAADSAVPSGVSTNTSTGDTPTNVFKTTSTAQKNKLYTHMADGGKVVWVGKGYFDTSGNATFPATTSPVMFTAFDGTTDYTSRNEDGTLLYMSSSGGNAGQYGMYMLNASQTYECDIIFKDIVILNRLSQTQVNSGTLPSTITVKSKMVIDSSVEFAEMRGQVGYYMHVDSGAFLYLHADPTGFDKYTGTGTIVIGDEILTTVTEETFAQFEGLIVDKNGNELFVEEEPEPEVPFVPNEPVATSSKVIFISYDTNVRAGVEAVNPTVDGGDTATNPYSIKNGLWIPLVTEGKAKDGGTIVIVGKGYMGGSFAIPVAADPVVFTSVYDGIDYTSYNEDGTYNCVNGTGQFGSILLNGGQTLTIDGVVILDNTTVFNRSSSVGTFKVNGELVVKDNVKFATLTAGKEHLLEVSDGGVAYLHSLGFGGYSGSGTIVIGNEIIESVAEEMFADFDGLIVDMNGNEVFGEVENPEDPDTPDTPTAPERPTATGTDKIYISYASSNSVNGSVATATGGNSVTNAFLTNQTDGWASLMGTATTTTATTVDGNTNFAQGGTMVVVGKGYIGSNFTFPVTTNPVVITGKDGDTSYISVNDDGSYNTDGTSGQRGMFMLWRDTTVTIDGTIIFDNTVLLQRKTVNSKFVVNGVLVINDTVDIVNMGTNEYELEVADGGVAFLDVAGFGKYTGKGTLVLGEAAINSLTKADLSEFEGRVIDKDGNAVDLFPKTEPESSSDKVIYIVHDKTEAGVVGSTTGGATADVPYKTGVTDGWKNLLEGDAKDGGTLVLAGKGFIGANFTFPATTTPLVFTSVDNGTSYISKDAEGNIYFMTENGLHAGQYGMFMLSRCTVTFDGDVIFKDTVILNRLGKSNTEADNSNIIVNGRLVITDSVQFAKMQGGFGYNVQVSEGAYLYLHADAEGFGSYTGTGTIVIGDEILATVSAQTFDGFEGRIVDKNGNEVFGEDDLLTGTTGDCTYTYNWITGVLTITGNGVPEMNGFVRARKAKEIVFGEGVTAIPDLLCYKNTNLQKVTLSSTITSIGATAFAYTSNLTTVVVPENSALTTIGYRAFLFSGITAFDANDNITSVGAYAFRNCAALAKLDLGNNVTSIGEYAFAYTDTMADLTLGGTFTSIADCAFLYAKAIPSLDIPDTVTVIGYKAFMNAQALATVELPSALTVLKADSFKDTGLTGAVVLPDSVNTVEARAFYRSTKLTGLTLPAGLTSIGAYVVSYTGVSEITLPAGITTIPESAFNHASALTTVTMNGDVTSIGNYAFANSGITSIVIPETCTALGDAAFYGATALTTVTINAQIAEIPYKAFYNATALSSITLPASLTTIGNYAFYNTTALASIELPAGLTTLNIYSFGKAGLTSITLPAGVTDVPAYSFVGCTSLATVTVNGELASIGKYAFNASGITEFTIPESCTTLDHGIFMDCKSLTQVTVNAPVKVIPVNMYRGCSALVTAEIPSTVESIQAHAYHGCTKLASITIPSNLKYLYNHAFTSTTSLKVHVTLPGTLRTPPAESVASDALGYNGSVGYYCFNGSGITGLTLEEGIESIGYAAFYQCRNMKTSITIPTTCTVIDDKAFARTPLLDVYIPASVTRIGTYGFFRHTVNNVKDSVIFLHTEENATAVIDWASSNASHVICVTDYGYDPSSVTVPDSYNKQFDANKSYGMYNYCPSIMQLDENTMYIYYCTNKTAYNVTDYIGCRKATKNANGTWTWSSETIVLSPTSGTWDERHVCDPSVVKGNFTYNGTQYSYLMAYLGCVTSDNQANEIGIAVAQSPEGPFVKVGTDAFIGFELDTTNSTFQWGVGQASLININKDAEIMFFYTRGDVTATSTKMEKWNLSDLNNPVKMTDTITLSKTGLTNLNGNSDYMNNADFVYDAESRRFYASSDCHPNPTSEPDFISSDFRVTYFNETDDYSKFTWRELCTIGADETGYARNHNTGILRDAYGHLANDYISVYYTISDTGSSSLWSYRIYDFHIAKAK